MTVRARVRIHYKFMVYMSKHQTRVSRGTVPPPAARAAETFRGAIILCVCVRIVVPRAWYRRRRLGRRRRRPNRSNSVVLGATNVLLFFFFFFCYYLTRFIHRRNRPGRRSLAAVRSTCRTETTERPSAETGNN